MSPKEIIAGKPFLRQWYEDQYQRFADAVGETDGRVLIEIGSGGGFIKAIIPNTWTSDIEPGCDSQFSAEHIPYASEWVDAFFLLDVLHHLHNPANFFHEAQRCLKPGGKVVMVEPANTWWSRFVYRHFHHEPFHTDVLPSTIANNQAMPWIVFVKQRPIFEKEFPRLRIVSLCSHTPFAYCLSGGLTYPALAPAVLYPVVRWIDGLLGKRMGMFMTIVLEKTA